MLYHDAHAGSLPTLADRLYWLNDILRALAARLQDAIASTVGKAVSKASRDLVRTLLGQQEYRRQDDGLWPDDFTRQQYAESSNGFDADSQDFDENEEFFHQDSRRQPGSAVLPQSAAPAR